MKTKGRNKKKLVRRRLLKRTKEDVRTEEVFVQLYFSEVKEYFTFICVIQKSYSLLPWYTFIRIQ